MTQPEMAIKAYGTQAQQAILRRARAFYALLGEYPRLGHYGRGVGVLHADDPPVAMLVRLV
jgi:hypothetical protein